MRGNYLGLFGYLLMVIGLGMGGWAIVAAASDRVSGGMIKAIIAIILFALGSAILVGMSRRRKHDPLEPMMTDEGIELYGHDWQDDKK